MSSCKLTTDVTSDWLTTDTIKSKVTNVSTSIMSFVTTSELNGQTKWHGPGHAAYDAAAATIGSEVTCVRSCAHATFCRRFAI